MSGNYIKFRCNPQINSSYIITVQLHDYKNYQKYLVLYKNVNLWLLLQSSDNHIFKNYLSNDIVSLDQLFLTPHSTHSSSESKEVSCHQAIKLYARLHHQFPTYNWTTFLTSKTS